MEKFYCWRKGSFVLLFFSILLISIAKDVKVLDKFTQAPLKGVKIYTKFARQSTWTDEMGNADLSAFRNQDTIYFFLVGYQTLIFSYKDIGAMGYKIYMTEPMVILDEFVITFSRFEERKIDIPQQIEVIKAKEIGFLNQPTTADLLSRTGKIALQKSQLGGGSPVLRGFEANKVLLVVDGVR